MSTGLLLALGHSFIAGSPENENSIGGQLGWHLLLGCSWKFALLPDHPPQVGVNFAALAVLVLLLRTLRPSN
jgi:hypothetical protein